MAASFSTPTARSPRGAVKVNGEQIVGWVDFEVENAAYYSADTFKCRFAASALPKDRGAVWFSNQQDQFVELFIGFPLDPNHYTTSQLKSWIYGQVDTIEIDPVTGMIEVSGRDLTRVFIDTKITAKWPNQTSSQIATALAEKHGLTPVVTPTKTLAGKYYEIDHVSMAVEQSEWDILTYLADREGFKCWVRGQSLYFQPVPDPKKTAPYTLTWKVATLGGSPAGNFQTIKLKRALTVSRGIQVKIRSWNKRQAKGFTVTWPAAARTIKVGQSTTGTGGQIYSKRLPNLTQSQAMIVAQNWYNQIIAHEMTIDVTLPGDNALDTTSIISLTGTGTAFDQIYYPESITRTLSFDGGYDMTVAAKNSAPSSEVML